MRRVKHQKQMWRMIWRRVRRESFMETKARSFIGADAEVWLEELELF
jgi:hypothetical protein